MADNRPDRDTDLEPYCPRPIPDAERATPNERLYWTHAEELRTYTQESRMDRGHTAVTANMKEVLVCMERYHASRAARIEKERAAASKGDILAVVVGEFESMPIAQQDAMVAALLASVAARNT